MRIAGRGGRWAILAFAALAPLATVPVAAQERPARDGIAVYLALGKLDPGRGPRLKSVGRVFQAGLDGKVLSSVELPQGRAGLGLAFRREGSGKKASEPWCLLLATAAPDLILVDSKGIASVVPLKRPEATAGERGGGVAFIDIAVDPATGDTLVADNRGDRLLLLTGWPPQEAAGGHRLHAAGDHLQNMHLAFAGDESAIFSTNDPAGTYWIRRGSREPLGDRVLTEGGVVAGDPTSNRWAFASTWRPDLRVFAANREFLRMKYPKGAIPAHPGNVAFGPGGILVMALSRDGSLEFVEVDTRRRAFRPLFIWTDAQLAALQPGWTSKSSIRIAVGPRLPWGETAKTPSAPEGNPAPGDPPPEGGR